MRRIIVTALLAFAVAPVAASVAAGGSDATKNASVACTALKAKIGATSFAQAYTSFGACVSAMTSVEQQNIAAAQASCTAEQADPVAFAALHGGKTFAQFYGTGKNDKNALAKCVSTKAQASSKTEQLARPNPSRNCRTLRTQLGVNTFALRFGAASNAFGKCVSSNASVQAKAKLQASIAATTACAAERTANVAAFNSKYGSFKSCVAQNTKSS